MLGISAILPIVQTTGLTPEAAYKGKVCVTATVRVSEKKGT